MACLYHPHSGLSFDPSKSVLITGCHIQVLDSQKGDIIDSTASTDNEKRYEESIKSGPIRCFTVDSTFEHIVTSGEDKKLKVWKLEGGKQLTLESERELPKKPTEIRLTRDGQTILVSDKFGDVFGYPLNPSVSTPSLVPSITPAENSKRGTLTSHENPSNGTLVLGHTSLLTGFILTDDEKYIVTADRDEHIRISWYPKGFVIERYCLGHKKFVSSLHIPSFSPSTLISAGGDPSMKLWDWLEGRCLLDIPIWDIVEPFVQIRPPKGRFSEDGEGEGEGVESNPGEGRRGRRKGKGKGKGKAKDTEQSEAKGEETTPAADQQETQEDVEMVEAENTETAAVEEDESTPQPLEEALTSNALGEKTLVVHRIGSMDLTHKNGHRMVVFSAVGATALFYFVFPLVSNHASPLSPAIHSLDFGKPVIDFIIESDQILVLLDAQWSAQPESMEDTPKEFVKVAEWQGDKLVISSATESPFVKALNSTALVSATSSDLQTLALYSALQSLPKHTDLSSLELLDPVTGIPPSTAPMKTQRRGTKKATEGDSTEGETLTQRELARLKNKKALEAFKVQQGQQSGDNSTPVDEEREVKKARSESGNE
ncbi:WD40-repeat-containing domain protein [Abortiporus biennis]|nr:WD40-repeat-containing domain protein [Abortiporus biennis]